MEGVFTWSWYSQENPFRILASVCMTLVSFLFSHLCSDVICNFSTAIGLLPGGSSTVHIYTHTIHRTTQLNNWEGCGPCPVFASYTLAFALELRKKHGKPSVRAVQVYILPKHTHYKIHTCTHPHITYTTPISSAQLIWIIDTIVGATGKVLPQAATATPYLRLQLQCAEHGLLSKVSPPPVKWRTSKYRIPQAGMGRQLRPCVYVVCQWYWIRHIQDGARNVILFYNSINP